MSDLSDLIGRIYESVGDDAALQSILEEAAKEEPLASHLKRAVSLHGRLEGLEAARRSLEFTLHNIASPVILLDRQSSLVFANDAGRKVLSEGVIVGLRNGRLEARGTRPLAWASAWESVLQGRGPVSFGLRHSARLVVGATLQLVGGTFPALGYPFAEVALFLRMSPTPALPDWHRRLALTPAEVRLAERLVAGDSPTALAARWHLSRETIKTQMASLFRKTDTHRQAQLVAFLAALMAGVPV
jgi:DNA-binding CsgD family transcriptional regulator